MSPPSIRLTLPGLPRPRGTSAHARRLALARESDAQLGARLHRMLAPLRALDEAALTALARAIDLPLGELVASPFGLRMIALGARLGVRSVRHETRALSPSEWERGVLVTGKYDAFRQDDPFVTYHPEHVAKWAPHEFLHRAVGFFDRPGAPRFERYLGARLNEILPVSTWYGLEHALRLDNDGQRFDAALDGRAPSAAIDRATWRTDSPRQLRERCQRAAARLRWTLLHSQRELDAVDRELAEGRVVRVVHPEEPHLDASSDAMAYAIAHHARLESEPVSRVLGSYAGASRFTRVAALRKSVESTLDALLFSPITLDVRHAIRAQDRRRAWDLASRLAHASPRRFASIEPLVRARSGAAPLSRAIAKVPGATRALNSGDGERVDVLQLDRGLRDAAPRARAHVGRAVVRSFAISDALLERASLPERFARFLGADGAPPWLVELSILEARIAEAVRSDPSVESLLERGPLPMRSDPVITASSAFRLARFTTDVLALHAGAEPRDRPNAVLVGRVDGAVSLVAIDVAIASAWEAIAPRPARLSVWIRHTRDARRALDALAAHGAIGWTRA